jgi:hypothetical protein
MGAFTWFEQIEDTTYTDVVDALPAGTTLLGVEFWCTTSYAVDGTESGFMPFAPPNTLLGVSWAPHGTTIPVVAESNITDALWYVAGFGKVHQFASEVQVLATTDWQVIRNVTTHMEIEFPDYQFNAYDLGVSVNFLGGGFYPTLVTAWQTLWLQGWYT